MEINLKADLERLQRRASYVEKQVLPKAVNTALNRGGTRGSNEAIREVAQDERLPQTRLRERVRRKRSNWRTLTFRAFASRETITYYSLGNPRQTKQGVTVGGGRTRRRLQGAFLAHTRSGKEQIFRRKGKARYPLEVPRKYIGRPFRKAFEHHWKHTARPVYVKTLHHEIKRRLARYRSR